MNMWQLKQNALEDLKDNLDNFRYPEDAVTEIADSWTPVYNGELLELALDDLWLGYPEEEFCGEEATAYSIIAFSVYRELYGYLSENLDELLEELEEG